MGEDGEGRGTGRRKCKHNIGSICGASESFRFYSTLSDIFSHLFNLALKVILSFILVA